MASGGESHRTFFTDSGNRRLLQLGIIILRKEWL